MKWNRSSVTNFWNPWLKFSKIRCVIFLQVNWCLFKWWGETFIVQISGLLQRICFVIEEVTSPQQPKKKEGDRDMIFISRSWAPLLELNNMKKSIYIFSLWQLPEELLGLETRLLLLQRLKVSFQLTQNYWSSRTWRKPLIWNHGFKTLHKFAHLLIEKSKPFMMMWCSKNEETALMNCYSHEN